MTPRESLQAWVYGLSDRVETGEAVSAFGIEARADGSFVIFTEGKPQGGRVYANTVMALLSHIHDAFIPPDDDDDELDSLPPAPTKPREPN